MSELKRVSDRRQIYRVLEHEQGLAEVADRLRGDPTLRAVLVGVLQSAALSSGRELPE